MVILGFAKDQLSYYTFDVYEKEVRNIIEVCREYAARFNKEIPVVLGRRHQHKGSSRPMLLGVDAIQAATVSLQHMNVMRQMLLRRLILMHQRKILF